ncbi:MAG: PLP-dependent transferase, partial [Clostridia bacterium]|nr:PLP-dependent transferase [Clostridia bacterium]
IRETGTDAFPRIRFGVGQKPHPQYELAKKQMTGACGLMSVVFDLPGEKLVQLGKELQCFHVGPSWGGYESMYTCAGAFLEEDTPTCKKGMASDRLSFVMLVRSVMTELIRLPTCGLTKQENRSIIFSF